MQPYQQRLATALLAAGLSQQGFIKATTIMSLEDVLRIMEKDSGERRNPEKYYFTIFGTPSAKGTWGYSVEGHHVSQNYTIVNGKISDSPSFFGTNPAEVREGPRKGLRVLAQEEDLGRDIDDCRSLPISRRRALVDATAYKDIITFNSRKAAIEGKASGLLASKMNATQFDKLMALLQGYADNMPAQESQARMDKVKAAGKNIYFAWAGVTEVGGPHYYRVQSPTFLVEYDNTQNDNNHIHSVWRDFNGDFGEDLLKAALRRKPQRKIEGFRSHFRAAIFWLLAIAGRLYGPERRRYADPATEFEVIRLTDPIFASGFTSAGLRQFTRRSDSLLHWSDRDGTRQAYLLN